jgi:hypothetical protein
MHRALAIALLAAFTPAAQPVLAAETPPAWLYATPGSHALLGTDGQDAPQAIVCPSAAAYKTMSGSCFGGKESTPIVIDAVVPTDGTCDARALLQIHATDGSWRGFANIEAVYPAIPAGTVLQIRTSDPVATISSDKKASQGSGTALTSASTVKVISFVPAYQDRDLLVTVVSGPHTGLRGWTLAAYTSAAGRQAAVILCPNGKVPG